MLEFPRVPWPEAVAGCSLPLVSGGWTGNSVWDWDAESNAAVVPQRVKIAVVHQANWCLDPARAEALGRMQSGLASQSVGGLSESYQSGEAAGGSAGWRMLCPQARMLLERYRLRSGRLV